ncbi:MAG: tetratricopeptide repeat protein [Gemmatimonadetes bacterium]|nr:tetratricopeptide repeat protein [Gemmatimonadota bacterium]
MSKVAPDAELDRTLRRAHALGDEGDWDGMAVTLREALESWPDDPYLLCWLAVAERELGLGGIAYEHFKACLAKEPRDPHVLATAGNAIAAFDDPEAEPALRTAALLAPHLPLTRWLYGAYLAREGMTEDALRELDAAVELDPDDGAIQYERGVALALSERYSDAVDAFFRATELDPDDAWARLVLGLALVEDGRPEEAAGELERGARDSPEDLEAQILAALAAAAAGYEDRAWEMLERARMSGPEVADARLVGAAEERLSSGAGPAGDLLVSLAPGALRERLMSRP